MINKLSDEIKVLTIMSKENMPIGAIYISEKISIPSATVGRILKELEEKKIVTKISNKGRVLTEIGKKYLQNYLNEKAKIEVAITLANSYEEITKEKLIEILEVRKILEKRSIELACINRTKEQLDEIELIMKQHTNEICNDELGNEQDLMLHLKIAEMSHNKTLYYMCKLLLTENNAYTFFSIVTSDIKLTQLNHHERLVKAIKERNVEEAEKTMTEHIDRIIADVEIHLE